MTPSEQIRNPHWRANHVPDLETEGRRLFDALKDEALNRRIDGPSAYVRERVATEDHLTSLSPADLLSVLRGFKAAMSEDIESRVT